MATCGHVDMKGASLPWGRGLTTQQGGRGPRRGGGWPAGAILVSESSHGCCPSLQSPLPILPLMEIASPLVGPFQVNPGHTLPCPGRLSSPSRDRPPALSVAVAQLEAWSGGCRSLGPGAPPTWCLPAFRKPAAWALQLPLRSASSRL